MARAGKIKIIAVSVQCNSNQPGYRLTATKLVAFDQVVGMHYFIYLNFSLSLYSEFFFYNFPKYSRNLHY